MAEDEQGRALREELARLDAEMADGERNADDVAAKAKRRAEIGDELARLGIDGPGGARPAATYYDPP